MKKKLTSKGSCLCGGVKFKTKGFHRQVSNCHCIQCMKTHGNFAAYTALKDINVKFITKRTLRWFKSSKKAQRGFCKKCGASILFNGRWLELEEKQGAHRRLSESRPRRV